MAEEGTCSWVSVEYRGKDTNTQVEAGSYKHFIDVWLTNGGQEMVAGEAVFKKPALWLFLLFYVFCLPFKETKEDIPDSLEKYGWLLTHSIFFYNTNEAVYWKSALQVV